MRNWGGKGARGQMGGVGYADVETVRGVGCGVWGGDGGRGLPEDEEGHILARYAEGGIGECGVGGMGIRAYGVMEGWGCGWWQGNTRGI